MPVKLRIPGTACPMTELRGDEPCSGKPARAPPVGIRHPHGPVVGPPAHETRLALQPGERLLHGPLTRLDDRLLHQRIAQGVHHRHRLRHRERQIEARNPPPHHPQLVPVGGERRPRSEAGEDGLQILAAHLPRQAEAADGVADPPPGDLTLPRVVVLQP